MHTPKIHLTPPRYSQAFELSYSRQTTGEKEWHQRFGFPEIALNLSAARYGSAELGMAFGFYPSIAFPILRFKHADWYWKLGGGIGMATQSWQRTPASDSMNNILGSKVNNFTMIQTAYRFSFQKHWTIQAGIHFFHVSNAAARQPNYGINTLGVFLGAAYHRSGYSNTFIKKSLPHHPNPLNLGFRTSISFSEAKTVDGPIYPHYNFTLFGAKMYRNKSRAILGADATYSSKVYAFLKNGYTYPGKERKYAWQYSVFAGHEFVFGKIGLPLQLGYYLNHSIGGNKLYQKLGLNYHFYHRSHKVLKDLFLFTQLKTHYASAEYAEIGLGCLF